MLLFEKSREGRGCAILPECDVPVVLPQEKDARKQPLHMPALSEPELSRHDQFICAKTPANRWLKPEELAGPAVFLASEASDI